MFDNQTRTIVVVGAQWGDEGKGKLVDVLAERADWVVRYQGGANAGHTVHIGDKSFVLHQIPSGILHPGVRCAIGNGVVLDVETLFAEIDELVSDGIDVEGRLYVSDRAHLVMPYHKLIDSQSSASKEIGTTGRGIAPKELDSVSGVVKAYTTRVGNGPLPTEFEEPLASEVRNLGNEFGATTGRPRRCGWFDGVVVRYAARVNGLTDLAVTKLDVLDTLDRLALCTGYQVDGEVYEEFPGDLSVLDRAVPRYEWFEGWRSSTADARGLLDLPTQARRYLDRIQSLVETQITYVSVGTRRDQIIGVEGALPAPSAAIS